MAPSKIAELEKTVEVLQKDVGKIASMELNLEEMKKQMSRLSVLMRKLSIPLFDGENPEGWVLRVEEYFDLGSFTEEEKLQAARMSFDDETLFWYRCETARNPFLSWDQMKTWVLEEIATSRDTTAGERLMKLRQEDTVKSYCEEFVALASKAPEFPENVLKMLFVTGLKPKIKAWVKMFDPQTLIKMMSQAKLVDDWVSYDESPPENVSSFRAGRQ